LIDVVFITHKDVCPASAKCHNAISLLRDLADVVSSPMYSCSSYASVSCKQSVLWFPVPRFKLSRSPLTASSPLCTDFALDLLRYRRLSWRTQQLHTYKSRDMLHEHT
jgi:hypothetical protein